MTVVFGSELRKERMAQGVSLARLSKLIHYSKGHLSRIETGGKRASLDLARRCDEALSAGGKLLLAHRLAGAGPAPRAARRPSQLPPDTSHFTGRRSQLEQLGLIAAPRPHSRRRAMVLLVDGMPGVGKTALALRWAHRNAAAFGDGILFHDLRAYGPAGRPAPTEELLAASLRALGVDRAAIPESPEERSALFRTLLDGRHMLVVLDNAASADQVRALLPGAPGCVVLVTSRNRLAGLVARDGAVRLSLRPFTPEESAELLRRVAGPGLENARPEAIARLSAYCGHVPLALRILAERLSAAPGMSPEEVLAGMTDPRGRLDLLSCADDMAASVRTVFSWSHRDLGADMAPALGVIDAAAHADTTERADSAEFSVRDAARLPGMSLGNAMRVADRLYQANLLELTAAGTYRCNGLLTVYVRELAGGLRTQGHQ
ncbi:helix-turn-helix domain-containing protein [Streptomyces sp. MP131-18]|uniref:helix-turn-helix domain-containing protein n=1 Tax=Streptomyces sp. MP131-18 TaxID=1857892 RepID=UPI00097C5F7B|nr:helix-turn-helix domain-containing protein [Streptomyces sp. MP131-18]ONK16058.1 Regulatory protein AfsR [Streptomyces sp. MP131-18]